jgi:vacuolar-type H+-ATPase subunit D/Vma8
MEERTARSIASSLQKIAESSVQINNRLAEIGKVLKNDENAEAYQAEMQRLHAELRIIKQKEQETAPDGD